MQAGADTIGGYGCALTSTAMMLNYFGASLTPQQLNACLGTAADPLIWASVPQCTKGIVSGGDQINFTWTDLDALLASGRPAIVGMLRGLTGSHFVVVTSGGGGLAQNYHITDPWDATTDKTLGAYIDAGYTPTSIISFSGAGHNCGRLIKGVVPSVTGIQDGGVTKNPVTINILPNIKNIKLFELVQLSSGAIVPNTIDQPLNYSKVTPGQTITDEGIYQLLLVTQAPSKPPIEETYRFTIDRTPPAVDLSLLNLLSPGDAHGTRTAAGASTGTSTPAAAIQTYPLIGKPGMVRIQSSDTLSGVASTRYSLDGGALTQYSSDTNFNPVLVVPQSGNHALTIQSLDAAGNMQQATKYFTVFGAVPTPTPPPPPKCTTALVFSYFRATGELPGTFQPTIVVSWSFSAGCPPYHGSITDTYSLVAGGVVHQTVTTQSAAGQYTFTYSCTQLAGNVPKQTVTFSMFFADSVGHSYTKPASALVC